MTEFVLPTTPTGVLVLIAAFVLGLFLGVLYFGSLWWNARLLAQGNAVARALAFLIGRFVLLAGALVLIGRFEGWAPLLATAAGILLARVVVVRRLAGTPA